MGYPTTVVSGANHYYKASLKNSTGSNTLAYFGEASANQKVGINKIDNWCQCFSLAIPNKLVRLSLANTFCVTHNQATHQ